MSETIKIYRNRVWLSVVSVIALLIGMMFVYASVTATGIVSRILPGMGGLIGLSAIFNLLKANDKSPAVEINDNGVLVKDVSLQVIPWSAIVNAKLWRTRAAWNITLELLPDQFAAIQPKLGSRLFSRRKVTFMASYLDRSPESIFTLISSRTLR